MARTKKSQDPIQSFLVAEPAVQYIRDGFSWQSAHRFQQAYEFNDNLFAKIIGLSGRTLTRIRRNRKALDAIASDRLYRAARILDFAAKVFEDKRRAMQWLLRPQPGLGGKVPLEWLDTEPGVQAVEALLGQIEHGIVS